MSHQCKLCGSELTERLTGEEVDFIGFRTAWDEDPDHGWTYLHCLDCGVTSLWWLNEIVDWDLSQMAERLAEG
jgi:hypothetical protein